MVQHQLRPEWTLGQTPWVQGAGAVTQARARVIVDNDFAGDPDDLFQLVHHLLSPNVDIRGIVCSHLAPGDPFYPGSDSADAAQRVVESVFELMRLGSRDRIWLGSNRSIDSRSKPAESAAANAIVAEAMRDDTDLPLYYCAGGGLTDLASAYLLEPAIATRLTLIWIGGPEHPGLAYPPPKHATCEYNLNIDRVAGQVIFNDSRIPIWQVPRNGYRQCLVSDVELRRKVANQGPLGAYLYAELGKVFARVGHTTGGFGETYALGDQPLVLLTALQSLFEADPSSSTYELRPTPDLDDQGLMVEKSESRPLRVFTYLDTRLMFEDMFAKLAEFTDWLGCESAA